MSNARLQVVLSVLLISVVACGSPVARGDGSPSPASTEPASGAPTATPRPTTRATPRAIPRSTSEASERADGTVLVTLPGVFGFAQPGDGGIWGILEAPGVGRDVVRIDPGTY